MARVKINPARYSQFGPAEGSIFCLITNRELESELEIVEEAPYAEYRTIFIGKGDDFESMLADGTIPQQSHSLVISPYRFFESPSEEALGPRRKLMGMACNSTPADLEIIRHFLGVIENTSAKEQGEFSDRFFELAESTDHLLYVDERHGTRAVLDHLAEDLIWNQQAGPLEWGEQQIVPSGEISVLPMQIVEFDEKLHLPLEGSIAFRGFPILHSGTPSFTRKDQASPAWNTKRSSATSPKARSPPCVLSGRKAPRSPRSSRPCSRSTRATRWSGRSDTPSTPAWTFFRATMP
jgi:hypothetical protein